MRNWIKNSCFLLLVLSVCSCEKEEVVPMSNTPVFTASVPFADEDELSIVAGDDLYYMYASHQSTEEEKILSGLFGKENRCVENCAENFSIKIHQQLSQTEKLEVGKYQYYSIPKDGYKHTYTLLTEDENATEQATWRVGDKSLSGGSISIDAASDSEPSDGMKLIYDVPDQYLVQFERKILPNSADCDVELFIDWVENDGVYLEVKTSSPFALVSWSTGQVSNRIKVDDPLEVYSAKVFDASGCTTDITIQLRSPSIQSDYSIGLNQLSVPFSTPDNASNSVSITYTDSNGDFYSSSIIGQILPFDFEILEIEPYENNENGEPTLKISAKFECILFGDNSETKRIRSGEAIFAVSY